MNQDKLINKKVLHVKYGVGTIVEVADEHLRILFEDTGKTSKFLYPNSFEKFLEAIDEESQKFVEEDLLDKRKRDEEESAIKREQYKQFDAEIMAKHRQDMIKRKKALDAKAKREEKERQKASDRRKVSDTQIQYI